MIRRTGSACRMPIVRSPAGSAAARPGATLPREGGVRRSAARPGNASEIGVLSTRWTGKHSAFGGITTWHDAHASDRGFSSMRAAGRIRRRRRIHGGGGMHAAAEEAIAMTGRLFTICAARHLHAPHFNRARALRSAEAAAQAVIDAADTHDSARCRPFSSKGQRNSYLGRCAQDRAEQTSSRASRAPSTGLNLPVNPNRAILAIGDEDWPFPVPIVAPRANGASTPPKPRSRCMRGVSAP